MNQLPVKDALLDELEELIYQCKNRFSNRYELATENEEVVRKLCMCLEQILCHGLRKNTKNNKLLNGILNNLNNKENINLWTFLKQFLTEHETQRFLLLRCVQTDNGRGSSWIRNALNEHSFERYIYSILSDKTQRRPAFYHEWALMIDCERSKQFLSHLKQLNSILFALNIDNADLDDAKLYDDNHSDAVAITSDKDKHSDDCKQLLVPNTSKRSHFVTINDSSECYNDSDSEIYARSAPNTSFLNSSSPRNFCTTTPQPTSTASSSPPPPPPQTSKQSIESTSASFSSTLKLERSSLPAKSSSSNSLDVVNDTGMILYPICDQESKDNSSNLQINAQQEVLNDNILSDDIRKRFVTIESERDKLERENTLLKIQLKKYIAAIELLKFNRIVAEESAKIDDEPNENSQNFIKDYENKLVKVSQMHGELVEFNDYLYKVIQQKDSIISRLRDELIELRGPLPETEDIMSTSGDGEQQSSLQSLVQMPLIHIWIPTAFLSGGFKGKSHHIYQIYIRIKEEEWNVYRRYSQFYTLHKTLKSTHRPIGDFEFPPKKAIGNKDSKVVQERRKKLEFYLRNVINHIQTLNCDITNKDKLVQAIPFLSDKFFLQDRSHSETNLSQQTQNNITTQPYMGF